jgi:hypothetical protein
MKQAIEFPIEKVDHYRPKLSTKDKSILQKCLVKIPQKEYYHISHTPGIKTLIPCIPDVATFLHPENNTIPRICMGISIRHCLLAFRVVEIEIESFINDMQSQGKDPYKEYIKNFTYYDVDKQPLYVYLIKPDQPVYAPTKDLVPEVEVSHEHWLIDKIYVDCIGKIQKDRILPSRLDPKMQYYNKLSNITLQMFWWTFKWLAKYSSLSKESIQMPSTLYDVSLSQTIDHDEQIKLLNVIAEESVTYYILYHTLKNIINMDKIDDPSIKVHETITNIHIN